MYVVSWLVYHHDIEVSLCLYYCFLWFYCSQNFKLFGFPKRTWWRLFQKRVVHTNFDIYVFNFYGLFVSYLCIFCFLIVCFCFCFCFLLLLFVFVFLCLDHVLTPLFVLLLPGKSWWILVASLSLCFFYCFFFMSFLCTKIRPVFDTRGSSHASKLNQWQAAWPLLN